MCRCHNQHGENKEDNKPEMESDVEQWGKNWTKQTDMKLPVDGYIGDTS